MKLGELRSIGHNVAASLADGVSTLTGQFHVDIFGAAAEEQSGYLDVDFLTGQVSLSKTDDLLRRSVKRFQGGLFVLCWKHRTTSLEFKQLEARYIASPRPRRFVVTLEAADGRYAVDQYTAGGARMVTTDASGRTRRIPTRRRQP